MPFDTINDYVALLLGVIFAGLGGELFVRGSVGMAQWARISPGIIGATVAAFATSSPELSVAVSSALAGNPQIALGDSLGSNVVNVALILGLALAIAGAQCPRETIKRDFPVALLIPVLTGVLFLDGELSRIDGILLLCLFVVWLIVTANAARKQRSATSKVLGEHRRWRIVASCVLGLALLVAAGKLIVTGGRGIALAFGIDEFIVGATVVAIGTSAPELATTIIAKLRGHDDIGLGTILGSNIFNGILVVALAAIIHPIRVDWREVAVTLVFGFVTLAMAYPAGKGFLDRRRGILLLALYVAYLTTILQRPLA